MVSKPSNAMPLSGPQRSALLRAVAWQLGGGLQAVRHELRGWRARASAIPDLRLRAEALHAIDSKRGHTDGAALFWTLAPGRSRRLLRLLVAFEVIYDYLDNVSELGARFGVADDRHLFRALEDAVDPGCRVGDYYREHPWSADGGYLTALVEACQGECLTLPGFAAVRPLVQLETRRQSVLGLNHDIDPERRSESLRRWAAERFPDERELHWYELTAASSQSVVTFTLLALAASPRATRADAEAVHAAYFPWFAFAVTMLDSYVDWPDDERTGAHSYVAYYPTSEQLVRRLCESIDHSARNLLGLPHGERHAILLGCMVAMYLSKDSVFTPELSSGAACMQRAGGTLTRLLLPILRVWRICNGQQAVS